MTQCPVRVEVGQLGIAGVDVDGDVETGPAGVNDERAELHQLADRIGRMKCRPPTYSVTQYPPVQPAAQVYPA